MESGGKRTLKTVGTAPEPLKKGPGRDTSSLPTLGWPLAGGGGGGDIQGTALSFLLRSS